MRIVAGIHRGRSIEAPPGSATRPTTDRVREALFSSLLSQGVELEGATVLDGFAGSGALGLEALSRGARKAIFFDTDSKAVQAIEHNIGSLGLEGKAILQRRDVMNASFPGDTRPFDVIFLDPPYATQPEAIVGLLGRLQRAGLMDSRTMAVYEHGKNDAERVMQAASAAGLTASEPRIYGKSSIIFLKEDS